MPDPAIISTMNRFRAQVAAGEQAAVDQLARGWLVVERGLQDQIELTARSLLEQQAAGRAISPALALRNERFQTLLLQTQQQISRYAPPASGVVTGRQRTLVSQGIDHAAQAINTIAASATFNKLPVTALENLIGVAGDGSPLRELLEGAYGPAAEGVLDEMVRGVAMGKGPVAIARQVTRLGLARGLDRVILINRSETLRVYRHASLSTYENSGIVGSYKRIASKSARTCIGCLVADGRIYPVTVSFEEHPAGRCSSVPIVDGAPVPTWKTGEEWFEEQPSAVQQDILGPGRYQLWKSGNVSFAEFATTRQDGVWGNSIVPTPLHAL